MFVLSRPRSCIAIADSESEAEQIARNSPIFTEDRAIYSTPEELVEKFQERSDAGCQHFQLRSADFPKTSGISRFGREVLPKFRSIS